MESKETTAATGRYAASVADSLPQAAGVQAVIRREFQRAALRGLLELLFTGGLLGFAMGMLICGCSFGFHHLLEEFYAGRVDLRVVGLICLVMLLTVALSMLTRSWLVRQYRTYFRGVLWQTDLVLLVLQDEQPESWPEQASQRAADRAGKVLSGQSDLKNPQRATLQGRLRYLISEYDDSMLKCCPTATVPERPLARLSRALDALQWFSCLSVLGAASWLAAPLSWIGDLLTLAEQEALRRALWEFLA